MPAPTTPFGCHFIMEDGSKGSFAGGSYDNISAVTIACCLYAASQTPTSVTNPNLERTVAVYDGAGTIIAIIGPRVPA